MAISASSLESLAGHCEEGEWKEGVPGRLGECLKMRDFDGPIPPREAAWSPTEALAFVDAALPGWILEHLADNATGTVGAMKPIGATCELTDGETTVQGSSYGIGAEKGIAFNRATAILVAALKALAHVERAKAAT
jgi:hypothetical protein